MPLLLLFVLGSAFPTTSPCKKMCTYFIDENISNIPSLSIFCFVGNFSFLFKKSFSTISSQNTSKFRNKKHNFRAENQHHQSQDAEEKQTFLQMKHFHVLKHSATEIIHQVPTRWEFGISSVLPAFLLGKDWTGNFLHLVPVFLWSVLFSGGLRNAIPVLWSHWDGQNRFRKVWLEQKQGQESWELQLWAPLFAQGTSHRLDRPCSSTAGTANTNWELWSSPQTRDVPSPQRGEAGDTHQEVPPVPPKLHRTQSSEPSGAGWGAHPDAPCPGHIPAATKWDLGSAVPKEQLHTSQHIQALAKDPIFSFLPLSSCLTLWLTSGYFGLLCIVLAVPWTAVEWGLDLMIQNCFRGKNQAVKSSAGSSSHPLLSHQNSVTLLDSKFRINRTRRVFSSDQGLCSNWISECTNSRVCYARRSWRMLQ